MKRYENYSSALETLKQAPDQDLSNEYIQSGVINKFALQFELGWKLLKRLLAYEGDAITASGSPRDIIKGAFKYYPFIDQEVWLAMLRDRNTITHVYGADEAAELVDKITSTYLPAFCSLEEGLVKKYGELLRRPDDQF